MKKLITIIAIAFALCNVLFAQELNRSLVFKEGDKLFKDEQYIKAMRYYKEVLDQEPNHMGATYQMGECYRLTFDYESALYYYEKIASRDDARFPLAKFHYANMLKQNGEFNRALQGFEDFIDHLKEIGQHTDPNHRVYYKQARIEKEGCLLALNDLTNPKPDHNFRPCSDAINTEYMDFAAFTYGENDQFICLTSSRSAGKGNLIDYRFGESFADLFRYQNVNGKWEEYKGSDRFEKTINTKWGDGSGSFNKSGTKFYYTNCNDDLGAVCHIFVSSLSNGQWSSPVALGEAVNLPGYDSRHPNVTPTGDTLFFSSNRPGGEGQYDIWMSVKASGENWSQPQNLGNQVNTPFYEVSPFYDIKEKALFFSSDGHRGYGGFDIYMAKGNSFFDPEIFNPGSPFNSNNDEVFMFIGKNKGYLSSNRDGGVGKLDIYEFDIKTEEEIITEISNEESIAGRNSLFSDDYEFDSDDMESINEIISRFLAARIVDVDLALTDDLARIYQNLSLDDKERINRIIYARIRNLNEKDLQALRVEDEFYYQDLNSSDKDHMDDLVTRYIEENELGLSVRLDDDERQYYKSLSKEDKEIVDHLIATRVKQANTFAFQPVTYASLPAGDRNQVDQITYKYFEEKKTLDQLTISPSQSYFIRELSDQKKQKIFTSVKEKILTLAEDPKYELREEDRVFYQNLTSEHLKALKEIASAFILSDIENISDNLSEQTLNTYRLFNTGQQNQLNRILAKIIENTIKADIYYAEANMTEADRVAIEESGGSINISEFISKAQYVADEKEEQETLKRFLTITAPKWKTANSVYIQPEFTKPEPVVASQAVPEKISSDSGQGDRSGAAAAGSSGSGGGAGEESPAEKEADKEFIANAESAAAADTAKVEMAKVEEEKPAKTEPIRPVVEKEQKIFALSSTDINFYESLPAERKLIVDRIIAMEYLNTAYNDQELVSEDEQYYKALTPVEKTYITLLSKNLKSDKLDPAEASTLKDAFSHYSNLAPKLKSKWNRLVAREALVKDGSRYKITTADASFRMKLSEEEKENLSNLQTFRFANERILSENMVVESKDLPQSSVNFGVAKFNNSSHNFISVTGNLIRNDDGTPMANFPLLIVDANGKTIAKTTTNEVGKFNFEDIPKGDYKVVAGQKVETTGLSAPFFVKDLSVAGSEEGKFENTVITHIYFDFDSDQLRKEALITLQEIARVAKNQQVYIQLKSHTDNIGGEDYNLLLSEKRNDRALEMLRSLGVKSQNIEWLALGKSSPVAPNNTTYGRQFNRRIDIEIKSDEPIDYQPADVYLVRPKGTLFSIAKNFGVEISEIQKANGLEGNNIKAYHPLRVPNPNKVRPNLDMLVELNESVANSYYTYNVKRGDSISSISEKFNIPEELLIELNDIKTDLDLRVGMPLRIYIRN